MISTFDDIDDQWEMFHSMILDLLNTFAPLHKVSSRRAKRPTSWFNDCTAVKIKEQNHGKRIAAQAGGEKDREVLK